jgi:hypothetical protein
MPPEVIEGKSLSIVSILYLDNVNIKCDAFIATNIGTWTVGGSKWTDTADSPKILY